MANTLKFGNGEWYGKKDTILAYNDENSNYKPLPFNFSRASSATVVNKAGLIETVGSGEPRIDYKDDSKGALKLEPQRSNIIDNSTNFFLNSWSGTRVSQGASITSPNGNNEAHKLIASSVSNTHYREYTVSSASAGSYTGSCFFKKAEFNVGAIRMSVDSYANRIGVYINLDNGTHLQTSTVGSPTGTSYKIEDYGNGWYRLSVTIIHTSGEVRMSLSNASSNYTNSNGLPVFLGNSSDGGYSWGAQLEQGSYATSYIPTQGSAVTRLADACNNGANEQVINSTEGVLYAEIKNDIIQQQTISLRQGTTDSVQLGLINGGIRCAIVSNNSAVLGTSSFTYSNGQINKYAIVWNGTNAKTFINGQLTNTITTPSPLNLNKLGFDNPNLAENMVGICKDVRVYNTALTDSELATLTTI